MYNLRYTNKIQRNIKLAYRKFVAEIKDNINGENYVTSFKWIN